MVDYQGSYLKIPIANPSSFMAIVLDEICFTLQVLHRTAVVIGIFICSLYANLDFLIYFAAMSIISLVVVNILFIPFKLHKSKNIHISGNGNLVINGAFVYTK